MNRQIEIRCIIVEFSISSDWLTVLKQPHRLSVGVHTCAFICFCIVTDVTASISVTPAITFPRVVSHRVADSHVIGYLGAAADAPLH